MAKSFLSFIDACRGSSPSSACWCPPADIYQTPEGWLIKLDLAGIKPGELQMELQGNCLTITGQRRDAQMTQTLSSYSLEISYNRFERRIELPCEVESARVSTDYQDGMLFVHLTCGGDQKQESSHAEN